jgi:hypothetical protein
MPCNLNCYQGALGRPVFAEPASTSKSYEGNTPKLLRCRLGVGGGISIYEGIAHLLHPRPLEDPFWSYLVLGFAAVFEGFVFVVAFRAFQAVKGEDESIWQAIKSSKDPTTFTVLFEDAAAMLGLIFAFVEIFLAHQFENSVFGWRRLRLHRPTSRSGGGSFSLRK